MARRRRFKVESLEGAKTQGRVRLPESECRHIQVLRLKPNDEVEVFDGVQRAWRARLDEDARSVVLVEPGHPINSLHPRLILATAWPKGKRAATLVEKCSELGVDEIIPLRCARSVVVKNAEGAGHERLCRIAAEAAKQSGRTDVPKISAERTLTQLLDNLPDDTVAVLLDPRADTSLAEVLGTTPSESDRCFLIGPEGGFTEEESSEAQRLGARSARLSTNTLRVETAAIAVCAMVRLGD